MNQKVPDLSALLPFAGQVRDFIGFYANRTSKILFRFASRIINVLKELLQTHLG